MTKYYAGNYKMILQTTDGQKFIFECIKLTARQAKEAFQSMQFAGVQIRSLQAQGYEL